MHSSSRPLEGLVGEPLNEVVFVMDYFQVGFNGQTLTCLTAGRVELPSGERFVFPGRGSRDALCGLIEAVVDHVADNGRELRLTFRDGRALVVPLDDESRIGHEAATFQMRENSPLVVW
jgi:hypothetical protein